MLQKNLTIESISVKLWHKYVFPARLTPESQMTDRRDHAATIRSIQKVLFIMK